VIFRSEVLQTVLWSQKNFFRLWLRLRRDANPKCGSGSE
jgi:hypothetical protein